MNLELQGLRVPLADFALECDLTLTSRTAAVFGPSGAGKTTLLETIAGLRRPETGRVRLDGETLVDTAERRWRRPQHRGIGYVPQDGALFPHLSVRHNLAYSRRASLAGTDGVAFDRVVAVLEIGGLLDRAIPSLSGGEQRRVAIGRALLSHPRLLLLDEPLAGLDSGLKDRLVGLLRQVRSEFGTPMILVTHLVDDAMDLCDDVVVLKRGRIVKHAAPTDVFEPTGLPRHRLRPE